MTEAEFKTLQERSSLIAGSSRGPKPQPKSPKRSAPFYASGPLSVTLTLWGHCPSKKNLWERGAAGVMFLPTDVKEQINIITTQAIFQWKIGAPVEHPDITIKFFVKAARRDRDGMLVTILDCLQSAGVLVNDNLARCNGRLILEPADFVEAANEKAEIHLEKT